MKKKLSKAQMKKLLSNARSSLGKLLMQKIALGEGPMSIPMLIDMGKKINAALKKL